MTPAIFKKHQLDEEGLKKYWTKTGTHKKRDKLKQLIGERVKEGMEAGLKDHKIWWAVDLAYDAPFNQLAPTIVRDILSKTSIITNTKDVMDSLRRWNVNVDDIICEMVDSSGCKKQVLNVPAFFQVLVPLVKAYSTIRRAKLFNDRNAYPFFKYEPAKNTTLNRLIGEILTDIVSQIATAYGYSAVFKQILLQMLQYGICLQFPMEEWHSEKQPKTAGEGDQTVREGLRYHLPHPTRMFWDLNHRPSTFNTDTGCQWAGYWRVGRYSDVADNEKYWNRGEVAYGSVNWLQKYQTYFQEVAPCSMVWPSIARTSSTGAGRDDREAAVAHYSVNDRDKAVFTVELFMKVNPAEWEMGDGKYEYETWQRFVVGGEDTVLWNSCLCYKPVIYWGYDPDEQRKRNSSLALEILPFQDHFSNLLSQYIYTVKQNLTRLVFYDVAQIGADVVQQVENLGRQRYSNVPFVPFDSRQTRIAQQDIEKAFQNVDFPVVGTNDIVQAMNSVLSILERILVLSNQEIGQPASHEQTAEETRSIAANTSTRVMFTGSGVDDGFDAWKRQLSQAAKVYLDEEQTAQVTINVPGAEEALKHLGFEVQDDGVPTPKDTLKKVEVLAKMSKVTLDTFISTREGQDRTNNLQMANAMAQVLQPVLANERIFMAIGESQIVELINQFAVLVGLPKDFKMVVQPGASTQQKMEALTEEVTKIAKQIQEGAVNEAVGVVDDKIAKPLVDQIVETDKKVQATQQAQVQTIGEMQEVGKALEALAQRLGALEQATMMGQGGLAGVPPPPPMMPQNALVPA